MRSLLADCSLDDRQRFITIPTPMPTRALVRKLTRPLCLIRNRFWTGLLQPSILAGFHTLTLMVVPSSIHRKRSQLPGNRQVREG
jgi:hypothetical protein